MTHLASTHTPAMIGLMIGCVVFGLGSVIVAHLPLGSFAVAFWRLFVSVVIFVILAKLLKKPFPKTRSAYMFALLSGAALGLDLALWHESIHAVGPGISTLLNSLQIFFLALIGFLVFKERQTKLQLLSLIIAIVGVGLIGSPEFANNHEAVWGFVAGVASGGFLAVSMSLLKYAQKDEAVNILPLMAILGVGGMLACLPVALVLEWGAILPTTISQIGQLFIYGAVMQCMAWGLIAYSVPKLNLALTGLLLLSEPVAALMIDFVWLDKVIVPMQWGGAVLTLFAIYLGSIGAKSRSTH